jgi:protein-disulfide isomerase
MQTNKLLVGLSVAMLIGSGSLQGEEGSAPSRAEIEKIVREYILQHPEVLMESVQSHRERERAQAQRRSKDAVAANRRELFDDSASPVAGTAGAAVTIVQFFDYKCGYCRKVSPTLSALMEKHKNVRIIYKELPILGADSHMAARAALAAEKQGAYAAFHRELMNLGGPVTPEAIEGTGKKLGLDVAKLKTDMTSKEVEGALMQNQRLASAIGVQSTPSFVIGGELISGAMDLTRFEEVISKNTSR